MNIVFGYARVSTLDQNLDRQLDKLKDFGATEIFTEKISGTKKARPQLDLMLGKVRAGDTIVIESLSRLGRSTKHLVELMELFSEQGINLVSLKENIDTSTATGKFIFSVFASISQFERDLIAERTKEGLASARARGRVGGRKKIQGEKLELALKMYRSNEYSISEIEKATGITKSTLYRNLNRDKG